MIWILAGTTEGRELVERLSQEGYPILVSVTTEYGAGFLQSKVQSPNSKFQIPNSKVQSPKSKVQIPKSKVQIPVSGVGRKEEKPKIVQGSLRFEEMKKLIEKEKVKLIVDATHPFSLKVSKNIKKAAEIKRVKCIRFERRVSSLPQSTIIKKVPDFERAAEVAIEFDPIFLAVGSKNLEIFAKRSQKENKRLIVRILPHPQSLKKCLYWGIPPQDIIAMQGPFSKELNKEIFKKYEASVLVTKDSGRTGGIQEKIEAALELDIPVILIERPLYHGEKVSNYEKLLELVKYYQEH